MIRLENGPEKKNIGNFFLCEYVAVLQGELKVKQRCDKWKSAGMAHLT